MDGSHFNVYILYTCFCTVIYKYPVPIQDQPGTSTHTSSELTEVREILSEILNDIFTSRKGTHSMIFTFASPVSVFTIIFDYTF